MNEHEIPSFTSRIQREMRIQFEVSPQKIEKFQIRVAMASSISGRSVSLVQRSVCLLKHILAVSGREGAQTETCDAYRAYILNTKIHS